LRAVYRAAWVIGMELPVTTVVAAGPAAVLACDIVGDRKNFNKGVSMPIYNFQKGIER